MNTTDQFDQFERMFETLLGLWPTVLTLLGLLLFLRILVPVLLHHFFPGEECDAPAPVDRPASGEQSQTFTIVRCDYCRRPKASILTRCDSCGA